MTEERSSIWPILHYHDPASAVRFLVDVLGFHQWVAARDDDGDVVHAELGWPGGGRVVVGGTKHTGGVHGGLGPGNALYVVTDDVTGVHTRAVTARADVVQAPHTTTFGSGGQAYAFTVRDPEGGLWTFGTYTGAAG
ncbi:glyoxalase [Spiractinospora alimapuensis]|uniref:VOC family protein n=1 Tax=Spiractinospora alimapuensis TaxID=2820884 RepID=UPI001F1AC79B|nr:VOC family protein [Spiractinospora alimapuensis]QVQ53804.1 glyoxalase [Spiractinospora alimapuensis]